MKKHILTTILIILAYCTDSQEYPGISYQATIRDAAGELVINSTVGIRISISQGSANNPAIFIEKHFPVSNAHGLICFIIGQGVAATGSFDQIAWSQRPFFIKMEADPSGQENYTISGISELQDVPYALHANTADCLVSGYFPGQDTLGGIVYYVYYDSAGQQHGLIVSKTETTAQWQDITSLVYADRTEDGSYNFTLMTNSPAKDWIISNLGENWYLPSVDELSILWHHRFHANRALRAGSHALLSSTAYYWSSTENSASNAFFVAFSNGNASNYNKTDARLIRAVRAF